MKVSQEDFDRLKEKWIAIGTSTKRADFAAAEEAITKVYRHAEVPLPQVYLHATNPFSAVLVASIVVVALRNLELKDFKDEDTRSHSGVLVSVRHLYEQSDTVVDWLKANETEIAPRLRHIADDVFRPIWSLVGLEVDRIMEKRTYEMSDLPDSFDHTLSWLMDQVENNGNAISFPPIADHPQTRPWRDLILEGLRRFKDKYADEKGRESLRKQIKVASQELNHLFIGANIWALVGTLMEYYRAEGLSVPRLDAWLDDYVASLAHSGQYWPFPGWCVISDRPTVIRQDDRFRLHSNEGPPIAWREEELYFLRGMPVPSWWVTNPEKITVKLIDEQQNMELRSAMLDLVGMERYLIESNARELDRYTDSRGEPVILYHRAMSRSREEDIYALMMTNHSPEPDGTFKKYVIRVPPTMRKAKAAMAWSYGLEEDQYDPMIET